MNKTYALLIFLLTLQIASCKLNQDGQIQSDRPLSGNDPLIYDPLKHSFQGDWQSGCYKYTNADKTASVLFKFSQAQIRYKSPSVFRIDFFLPTTDKCDGSILFSLRSEVNILRGDGDPIVTKGEGENLDIEVLSIELAPNGKIMELSFNANQECGFTNWQDSVFQNVSGLDCGQTQNTIMKMPTADMEFPYLASYFQDADGRTQTFLSWCSFGVCLPGEPGTRPTDISSSPFCLIKEPVDAANMYCNLD